MRKNRSQGRNISYIVHSLNRSKSKSTFSFQKEGRFIHPKSYSPNKFY